MSVQELAARTPPAADRLERALAGIASRAGELDRRPRFPSESFAELAAAGALSLPTGGLAAEVALVRAVAAADASTARILDGHLNGVERLTLSAVEPLRSAELARIQEGALLLGVWGADPAAGEGPPARLRLLDGRIVLRGVKTFCSGAGGVQRALVLAADEQGARRLAYLDTTSRVSVDRDWYRASGLRASESHRVEFHDTPVLALLDGLSGEPWFSRDAVRTSATWAGLVDAIERATLAALDPRRSDQVQAHALGRMRVARSTIDLWLDRAVAALSDPDDLPAGVDPATLALECRAALSGCARLVSEQAAQLCGSRALIGGSDLDRARRDLDLFLLQHRLDGKIAALGTRLLEA